MRKLDTRGSIDGLIIPLVIVVLLLIAVSGFAYWAFSGRQDYKNNVDQKVATAVTAAQAQQVQVDTANFAQQAKQPLKSYNGPAAYGSVVVQYPKTWNAYVDESSGSTFPVNGYFEPNFVPGVDTTSSYALRVQVVSDSYSDVIQALQGFVQNGQTTAVAYSPAKVPGATGLKFVGMLDNGKSGQMVVVPIRDKTLKIWTESAAFYNDFNNNILPNYSFSQ